LFFEKNAYFFRQNLAKIAENCDHDTDHRGRSRVRKRKYVSELGKLFDLFEIDQNIGMQDETWSKSWSGKV
jgi:hypothetical protein